jgi:hypothetical protein
MSPKQTFGARLVRQQKLSATMVMCRITATPWNPSPRPNPCAIRSPLPAALPALCARRGPAPCPGRFPGPRPRPGLGSDPSRLAPPTPSRVQRIPGTWRATRSPRHPSRTPPPNTPATMTLSHSLPGMFAQLDAPHTVPMPPSMTLSDSLSGARRSPSQRSASHPPLARASPCALPRDRRPVPHLAPAPPPTLPLLPFRSPTSCSPSARVRHESATPGADGGSPSQPCASAPSWGSSTRP